MPVPRGLFVGLTTVDVVHRLDELPGPDAKVTAREQEIGAGGPAAVAAIAFAALGGRATLITALGSHPLADLARADLVAAGVQVVDVASGAIELPVSAVRLLDRTGERSVSSIDATVAALAELDAPPELGDLVTAADAVLFDGHYARLSGATLDRVRARGSLRPAVVVDAGRWRPVYADLLPGADFVIASAAFRPPPQGPELPATHAVSHGDTPIEWRRGRDSGSIEVQPIRGGDTLGAGDVLHGAATFAIAALGADSARTRWPEVLRFAADVATVRVGLTGIRAWRSDTRLGGLGAKWRR